MTEQVKHTPDRPKYLKPWACPMCGKEADCQECYHHNGAEFWRLTCPACDCEFEQWTCVDDLEPTNLELDGRDYPLQTDTKPSALADAAPDLLAVLEALPLDQFEGDMSEHDASEFVDYAGAFFEAMIQARAAIAKATGEA